MKAPWKAEVAHCRASCARRAFPRGLAMPKSDISGWPSQAQADQCSLGLRAKLSTSGQVRLAPDWRAGSPRLSHTGRGLSLLGLALRGPTSQFVVHPYQDVVGSGIEPRHGRAKRACDAVYGATD